MSVKTFVTLLLGKDRDVIHKKFGPFETEEEQDRFVNRVRESQGIEMLLEIGFTLKLTFDTRVPDPDDVDLPEKLELLVTTETVLEDEQPEEAAFLCVNNSMSLHPARGYN